MNREGCVVGHVKMSTGYCVVLSNLTSSAESVTDRGIAIPGGGQDVLAWTVFATIGEAPGTGTAPECRGRKMIGDKTMKPSSKR